MAKRKKSKLKIEPPKPLWRGPEVDGITQSMLSDWLVCRERFRVRNLEGWTSADRFNHAIEYGQMFHECKEVDDSGSSWESRLRGYCEGLCDRYPTEQEQIDKWYRTCKTQYSVYREYWKPDSRFKTKSREQVFEVHYPLPSGREVILRGKWDGVDLQGKNRVWLVENKTKGTIDETQIQKQLSFDLQTMFYLTSLSINSSSYQIMGCHYNVIRRPFSGGKGSIRPRKATKNKPAETLEEFYYRLRVDYLEADPGYWFPSWLVEITSNDIIRFRREFLDPCLEHVCWWYDVLAESDRDLEVWSRDHFRFLHYRLPYGIYNPISSGVPTDLDEYLRTGSTVGLRKVDSLFPELEH